MMMVWSDIIHKFTAAWLLAPHSSLLCRRIISLILITEIILRGSSKYNGPLILKSRDVYNEECVL